MTIDIRDGLTGISLRSIPATSFCPCCALRADGSHSQAIEIRRVPANPREGRCKVMTSLHNRLFLAGPVLDIFRPGFRPLPTRGVDRLSLSMQLREKTPL